MTIDDDEELGVTDRSVAWAFVAQLRLAGVRWIFGNPGTTEQVFLDELQDHADIDLVLALHEGVAIAAAEGYARASREVGVVQLHAAPGLGNAMGMLYNASVGHTPLLVFVGQPPVAALHQEPTLNTDFALMAAPLTKWAHEVRTADELPQVIRRALKVAGTPPCGPVLVAVPIDLMESPCSTPVLEPTQILAAVRPDRRAVLTAAKLIRAARSPALVVGDGVATPEAVSALSALAQLIGAPIFGGTIGEAVIEHGEELTADRLPFDGAAVARILRGYDTVIGVGTKLFAQLFPVEGLPLGDSTVIHIGLDPWELAKNQPSTVVLGDEGASLTDIVDELVDNLDAEHKEAWAQRRIRVCEELRTARRERLAADRLRAGGNAMTPERVIIELAAVIGPDMCLVDESVTSYPLVERHLQQKPGNWFRGRGGGIGAGMAMPVGIALARPEQNVVCLTGDGSAMYSISALWTAAHHKLPITWVILDNRGYRMVKLNTLNFAPADRDPGRLIIGADLSDPPIDFAGLAVALGVPAQIVTRPDEIAPALAWAVNNRSGPTLVHILVESD